MPKFADIILVLITLFLVMKTCAPAKAAAITDPVVNQAAAAASAATDAAASAAAALASDTVVSPTTSPTLPPAPDDTQSIPIGLPAGAEGFGQSAAECKTGCKADSPEDPVAYKMCVTENCPEAFTQSVTPAPGAADKCGPSLIWKGKPLKNGDSELGCWALNRPEGGNVTGGCIEGGSAKVANFFDAAQTQTVLDAIDRDPSRDMKIRQSQATPNYDIRAAPPIDFNGYPTLSFIQGNVNTGLQTA